MSVKWDRSSTEGERCEIDEDQVCLCELEDEVRKGMPEGEGGESLVSPQKPPYSVDFRLFQDGEGDVSSYFHEPVSGVCDRLNFERWLDIIRRGSRVVFIFSPPLGWLSSQFYTSKGFF